MKRKVRLSIRIKFLIVLLCLSVVSLGLYAGGFVRNFKALGRYAVLTIIDLGARAMDDSTAALTENSKKYLQQIAGDQSLLLNAMLAETLADVNMMSSFVSRLWDRSGKPYDDPAKKNRDAPDDIYAVSSLHFSPGVSGEDKQVQRTAKRAQSVGPIFKHLHQRNTNLKTVFFATEVGVGSHYPPTKLPKGFDHREQNWYKMAVEKGRAGWSKLSVDPDSEDLTIKCFEPVRDKTGEILGVVGAEVKLGGLQDRIANTSFGEHGYLFLTDGQGRVISRPNPDRESKTWDESFKTENLLKTDHDGLKSIIQKIVGGHTGIARCRFETGDKLIAFSPLKDIKWHLGVVVPVTEILEPIRQTKTKLVEETVKAEIHIANFENNTRYFLVGISIFSIVFVAGIAVWFSWLITKPIVLMGQGAKRVGKGDLDHRISINTGDEIEELAVTFNRMTSDLKAHMADLKETTAAKERIESELRVAHDIQMTLLHKDYPPFPDRKEFDLFATVEPAREVGGDLFDFFFIDENRLCFVIGDVTGKGVPAAILMAVTQTLIKTDAAKGVSAHEVMNRVNRYLSAETDPSMFVTLFLGILNIQTGEVDYCNAGHNFPFIIHENGTVDMTKTENGLVLGVLDEYPYESGKIRLDERDILYLYTDGVTEAMNAESEVFSDERLAKTLEQMAGLTVKGIADGVFETLKSYTQGAIQSDDITMLVLQFHRGGQTL